MSEAPGPIRAGGTGDISMYPMETNDAMVRLSESGKAFGDAWRLAGPLLAADEAKVGTGFDDLSAQFRTSYNDIGTKLKELAGDVEENLKAMGAKGNDIVFQKVELSHQQTGRLRRIV
ncbi:hypothetical protein ACFTSF_04240 [Kribbella sp. NPDC056951]|uniref:hypothetical protein n=1 Tax=Kribbella sp. NPDC056951 TaxID=3345978 RepID=UPI003625E5FA